MFDIRIGTLMPTRNAAEMIPALNRMGFESYALHMEPVPAGLDYARTAERLCALADGRPISAIGMYGNTLQNWQEENSTYAHVMDCIRYADRFGCRTIGVFAGGVEGMPFSESVPLFREVFTRLTASAEEHGVRLALENCAMGGSWRSAGRNIAFNGDAWEVLFGEVPSDALGLEWEPAHALTQLIDPIPQLREWVKKIYHVHGKDATVAWDVIRAHGINSPEPYVWDRTPGYGDTNWCDVMTILLQNGYQGSVDIEGYHDVVFYDDLEWSAQERSLRYLKDCRGGAVPLPRLAYNGWRHRG